METLKRFRPKVICSCKACLTGHMSEFRDTVILCLTLTRPYQSLRETSCSGLGLSYTMKQKSSYNADCNHLMFRKLLNKRAKRIIKYIYICNSSRVFQCFSKSSLVKEKKFPCNWQKVNPVSSLLRAVPSHINSCRKNEFIITWVWLRVKDDLIEESLNRVATVWINRAVMTYPQCLY